MADYEAALAALRGRGEKDVTLPGTEITLRIRPVLAIDMVGRNILPASQAEADERQARARAGGLTAEDHTFTRRYNLAVLELGVVSPRCWTGEAAATPADAFHYSALGEHFSWVVNQINALGVMGAEALADAAAFPGESAGGTA